MTVVDLSHSINESMPVFPGTEPPKIVDACTIAKNGFAEKLLNFYSHTGTHIDAPGHILAGAATLDELPIGHFIGPGFVLDVSLIKGAQVEIDDLKRHEMMIRDIEFLLLHSGWAKHWGDAKYFSGYPALSPEAAKWLTGFSLKAIGVDMISVDSVDSLTLDVHRTILEKGMVVVENLAGLETLIGKKFTFSCLPLKIPGGDGSPIRAVAIIQE
jgi:kynurenine formamidase